MGARGHALGQNNYYYADAVEVLLTAAAAAAVADDHHGTIACPARPTLFLSNAIAQQLATTNDCPAPPLTARCSSSHARTHPMHDTGLHTVGRSTLAHTPAYTPCRTTHCSPQHCRGTVTSVRVPPPPRR